MKKIIIPTILLVLCFPHCKNTSISKKELKKMEKEHK